MSEPNYHQLSHDALKYGAINPKVLAHFIQNLPGHHLRSPEPLMSTQKAFVSNLPNSPVDLQTVERNRGVFSQDKHPPANEDDVSTDSKRSVHRKNSRAGEKAIQSSTATKGKAKKRSQSTQPEGAQVYHKKDEHQKIIMINDVECVKITGKPSDFLYDKQIQISENFKTEFKTFIKGDFKYGTQNTFHIILKYICAFLNSYGGTMFLGIKDDGTVTGVEVSDKIQDDFEEFITVELGKFKPHVHPWQVQIQYHPIMIQGNKLALLRRKIVQINVLCHHFNQLYVTGNDEIHIRRAASTNNLIPVEIIHLLKLRNNPLLTTPNLMASVNPNVFVDMSDEELQQVIENTHNTLLELKYFRSKTA